MIKRIFKALDYYLQFPTKWIIDLSVFLFNHVKKIFTYKVGGAVLVILILGGAFYWYEWRSSQIVKDCEEKAIERVLNIDHEDTGELVKTYDFFYKQCLRKNGIQPSNVSSS